MARLARRIKQRSLKKPAKKAGTKKAANEPPKPRTFSHRVRFARQMLHYAKHGPESNAQLEYARSRRSMEAHLQGDMRLNEDAVRIAIDVTMSLMNRVAKRTTQLLHFAGKRKAKQDAIKLAICDVMGGCSYLGTDISTMPQFVYRPMLPVFVHSKGRTTAEKLAEQFAAQTM
jgi:hypothetical protein